LPAAGGITGCLSLPTFLPEPKVVLRLAVPDASIAGYLTEQVRAFELDNPNVRVNIFSRFAVFRGTSLTDAINSLATTQEGLDLVYLTNQDFRTVATTNVLSDLTPYIRESGDLLPSEFYPMALPAFQDRGRQMALPTEIVPMVVFYNRDLFDQLKVGYPEPDWTLSDFQAKAKAIVRQTGPTGDVAAFVCDPSSAIWPFLLAHGATFPNAARDPSARDISSPEMISGLQWFADLFVRDRAAPPPPTNRQLGLWFSGKAAMSALYMNSRNSVLAQGQRTDATPTPGPRSTWPFRWDVAPIPRGANRATVATVSSLAITKAAKNPNEAWRLLRHLARSLPPAGSGSAYVPATQSMAKSSEYAALYPESGRYAYLQSADVCQTLPSLPPGVQIYDQDLMDVLTGSDSADHVLQRLRERLAPAFQAWSKAQQ
jgi:multiple sugar transport system substrate-binding protein